MKIHLFCIVGFLLLISISTPAQWVADPECYYPDFDDKTEVDYRHGTYEGQNLGDFFRLPPKPGSTKTRLAIKGLSVNTAKYSPRFDVIDPTVPFSVHSPQVEGTFIVDNLVPLSSQRQYGHFRNSKDVDMLIDRGGYLLVYWADENGLYDTSRRTRIDTYKTSDNRYYDVEGISPIVCRYSSDTVDDIIVGLQWRSPDSTIKDSNFIGIYQGGISLYAQGDHLKPDEIHFSNVFKRAGGYPQNRRTTRQGDYRGTGRQDILALDEWSNIFFYKRDGKFNPQEFLRAMQEDTLIVGRENSIKVNPQNNPVDFGYAKVERVLDKPSWDSSKDFIFCYALYKNDEGLGRTAILRGGSDFGKNRIQLDTVPTIYDPKEIDHSYLFTTPSYNIFIGQLTRSPNANKYLIVNYSEGSLIGFNHFYMLGDAFDNQADMIFDNLPSAYFANDWDTVDANGDVYLDLLFGAPGFGYPDKNISLLGSMGLIYGTSKIPHQMKLAVENTPIVHSPEIKILSQQNGILDIEIAGIENGNVDLEIRDILGRLIYERKNVSYYNRRMSLNMRDYPSGTYFLVLKSDMLQSSTTIFFTH